MAQTTIEQFATDLKMPAGALLEQLSAAGVAGKKQGDNLSEQDKTRLLDYLRKQHGAAGDGKKRITLTRKQTSEIKAADSSGKARTIQVEVRKKRVLVRREEEAQPVAAAPIVEEAPQVAAPPVISAEEIATREAESKQAQEQARIVADLAINQKKIEADRTAETLAIAKKRDVEIADQDRAIAVANKSQLESQATAEAEKARAQAVSAEESVETARKVAIAERDRQTAVISARQV
jgi:translation initiation factor IF-2